MDTLRLAVCSDLHFMAWAETLEPVDWVPGLYHALHDISEQKPDALIINGDLTNGKIRDYELAMRALTHFIHVPIFYTMGNHEYYGYYEDQSYSFQLAQARFLHYTGQTDIYFEKQIKQVSLFFLSPEGYHPDWHDSGWLSPKQVAWFAERLSRKIGPVLVFLHQPLNQTVAASENTCFQSTELKQLLASYQDDILLVSGHTHQRMDQHSQYVQENNVHYVGGGCVLKENPQTRFIDVSDTQIRLSIRDHKSMRWITDYEQTIPITTGTQSPSSQGI